MSAPALAPQSLTRERVAELAEMLARDEREDPMGQHNPVSYVSRSELAELVRGYCPMLVSQ